MTYTATSCSVTAPAGTAGSTTCTAIKFGTTAGTSVSCTATSCTVHSPAHTAGTVDITVTTPGGTSALATCDRYTYH